MRESLYKWKYITLSCGKSRKHHRRGTECVWMNWTALRWFPADVTGLVCWPTISEQLVSRAESCSPSNQSTLQHGWVKNVWETDHIHSRRATGSWLLLDCDNWEDASIVIHILVCHEAQCTVSGIILLNKGNQLGGVGEEKAWIVRSEHYQNTWYSYVK